MEQVPRPQLALPRRPATASPTPPSTRRSAAPTTARSAASRRRSRAAKQAAGYQESVNTYRFWSPDTVDRADRRAGQPLRRPQPQDRRRDVRPQPPARPRHLRPHHRARLRSEHLGLHARRHDQGRDAGEVEGGGLQLAGLRHRGRAPAASGPTWTRRSPRKRSTGSSSASCASRHQRHRQLHLRPAGGRPRHDAGDAGPGHRPQLRVRQLLFGDGLSRLAALRPGRAARACRCRESGPAIRSTPATACRCRRGTSPPARCCASATRRFSSYYTNPSYLEMVGRRFGPETVAHMRT